jgi:hypothetical protein
MQNRGNDVDGGEPHTMLVIVVLILSASAIAMPPSGPTQFLSRLHNEG